MTSSPNPPHCGSVSTPAHAPVVALVTDFGPGSMYVGVMHGVIATRAPEVRAIDLAHDIRPQNLAEAALCLEAAAEHFPRETVFCCVVDPGVGSARRALAAWDGRRYFVAPDNGVLTFVEQAARERATARQEDGGPERDAGPGDTAGWDRGEAQTVWQVRAIDPDRLGIAGPISATFQGRDLFAPAAAILARGGAAAFEAIGDPAEGWARLECTEPVLERIGPGGQVGPVRPVRQVGPVGPVNPVNKVNPVRPPAREIPAPPPDPASGETEAVLVTAHVLAIDSFGNAITTLRRRDWDRWWSGLENAAAPTPVAPPPDLASVDISLPGVHWRGIARTFSDVAPGQPVAYWGSGGRLEIGLRDGNAAARFSIVQGTPVTLRCPVGPERNSG